MATTPHDPRDFDALGDRPVKAPLRGTARAYCGPAHGRCWTVDTGIEPQSVVWLGGGADSVAYRVTFDPVTRRPARDRLGNLVYMPRDRTFQRSPEASTRPTQLRRAQAL
jgi:hypothetical protein